MITQRFDDPDSLVDGQLVKRPERQCIRHSCKQRMKPLNTAHLAHWWWIGLSSVLRPRQHSICRMVDRQELVTYHYTVSQKMAQL